jgi:large subunit ribosomal protein L25
MKTISISVKKRTDLGKKATRELRKNADVPCVMYGGDKVLHFYAHENEFLNLVYSPNVHLVNIDIEGEKRKAIMQELQFHPVTDKILHIDFIEVFDDKPVTISIPIRLTGAAIGIKEGGKPRQKRRSLRVKGLPANLPDHLEIDITDVNIGDVIKVGDLSYPNLEVLDPERSMVYAIVSSRVALAGMTIEDPDAVAEEVEEEEGAEAVEGEEGAEGAEEGGDEAASKEKSEE